MCNASHHNLNVGLTCSMQMRHWTCKPHYCSMIAISDRTSYLWNWYNRAESNYGLFQCAIMKFTWKKHVTRDFGNVNIPDKIRTRYCLNVSGAACSAFEPNSTTQASYRHAHGGVGGATVGWGTASQDGRFRVRFPAGPWKFWSELFLRSSFSSPEIHSASNRNEHRPARKADNSAILVVPIVKVRTEAEYSIPSVSLHNL